MLPIITDTDINNIILAPCKDSLYDNIKKNGLTFYKSPLSVSKLELFLNDFNQKKEQLTVFMTENNITEEAEYEHIILWDNSEYIKNHIIKSFEKKKETPEENKINEYQHNHSYEYDNNIYEYESDEYEFNDFTYNNYIDEYKEEIYEDEFFVDEVEDLKREDDYY
jgi:hypothetical protein